MAKVKQGTASLMFVIIISKLVGMFRDVVLANYFGTTSISDAYLIASTIPSLLFYFIGHSLSTAYIPMYNKIKIESGKEKAQRFSNNLLNIALILSTIIAVVLLLIPRFVIKIFAAGFSEETAQVAVRLMRISTPSIYLMSIVNICGGYLQANKNFLAPAAISLPRNAAIVVSIVLAASLGTDCLGWGLLASYLLELFFLLPFVFKMGYRYEPVLDLKDGNLDQTLRIITPILIGMCVGQVNKIIDRSMASTVIEGGISALTYASIINNTVQEVLVTGIITILFASCSELVAKQEYDRVKENLSSTINSVICLIVPACVGVLILAEPIVELVLCRGEFDQHSLEMTAGALRCYTLGLMFLAIRDTLVKVFYAFKETRITTAASVTSVLLNIILNIVLGKRIGIEGLALATSFSAVFNSVVLFVMLRRRIGDFGTVRMLHVGLKSVIGSGLMGMIANLLYLYLSEKTAGIIALFTTIGVSCIFYAVAELVLHNEPVVMIINRLFSKRGR